MIANESFRFRFSLSLLLPKLAVDLFFVIIPTFVTEATEYLCSGWFFFSRQISTFKLAIYDKKNLSSERYCCPELKFEKVFHL